MRFSSVVQRYFTFNGKPEDYLHYLLALQNTERSHKFASDIVDYFLLAFIGRVFN